MRGWLLLALSVLALDVHAQSPVAREGDIVLKNFRFKSGETLPEVRIHYHAFGTPGKDNTVLIVHGTGGSGGSLIRPEFSGELFGFTHCPSPPA